MPYRQVWFDPPKDESLLAYPELPIDYVAQPLNFGHCEAYLNIPLYDEAGEQRARILYYCLHCHGWVPASCYYEEPPSLLARRGYVYYCRRCGYEVA